MIGLLLTLALRARLGWRRWRHRLGSRVSSRLARRQLDRRGAELAREGRLDDAYRAFVRAERFDLAAECAETLGHFAQAAEHREQLGDWSRAAKLYERAGDRAGAARMLECLERFHEAAELLEGDPSTRPGELARLWEQAFLCTIPNEGEVLNRGGLEALRRFAGRAARAFDRDHDVARASHYHSLAEEHEAAAHLRLRVPAAEMDRLDRAERRLRERIRRAVDLRRGADGADLDGEPPGAEDDSDSERALDVSEAALVEDFAEVREIGEAQDTVQVHEAGEGWEPVGSYGRVEVDEADTDEMAVPSFATEALIDVAAQDAMFEVSHSAGSSTGSVGEAGPKPVAEPADDRVVLNSAVMRALDAKRNGRRFRLLHFVAEGGTGIIYRAYDRELKREVALKFLTADLVGHGQTVGRFDAEMARVIRLRHPHVVEVYAAGVLGGRPYVASELVAGEAVSAILEDATRNRLAVLDVLPIAEGLLSALRYAHEQGVVHLDVRPAKLLRSETGLVKLNGFGVARLADPTRGISASGASPYAAPERREGVVDDPRVDIYGVGATLYHLLAGGPPSRSAGSNRLPPPPSVRNPAVPARLDEAVLHCLARDPGDRPPTLDPLLRAVRLMRAQVDAYRDQSEAGPK